MCIYVSICYSLIQNRNRNTPLDVTSKELESTLFNKVGVTGGYGNTNPFLGNKDTHCQLNTTACNCMVSVRCESGLVIGALNKDAV